MSDINLADDQGIATKGSETSLEDLTKSWGENIWAGANLFIFIESTRYVRRVTSNTSTKLTFNTLPSGVSAGRGNRWVLKQAMKTQFTPIEQANQHDVSVTADTNILSSALAPSNPPCLFRIMVCLDTAGVFSAMVTKDGSTQQLKFNSASNLTADAVYIFDILVHDGDTVNFQHSATATLKVLRVQEIVGAVQ